MEAIALSSLVGKGYLDYREKICTYWPEFAANGKAELTVADLMSHEVGLAAFNTPLAPEYLHVESIKKKSVGSVIEGHPPTFPTPPASRREYHAITRGWIANEVFRRVDPAGRTIGFDGEEDARGADGRLDPPEGATALGHGGDRSDQRRLAAGHFCVE